MLVLASCAHARAPTFAGGSERALLADNPMTMDGELVCALQATAFDVQLDTPLAPQHMQQGGQLC
jgi:hypothetical protein